MVEQLVPLSPESMFYSLSRYICNTQSFLQHANIPGFKPNLERLRHRDRRHRIGNSGDGIYVDRDVCYDFVRVDQSNEEHVQLSVRHVNADAHPTAQPKGENRSFSLVEPSFRSEDIRVRPYAGI